ncbi:uncharacterized protein LOC127255380 [Andrographis paniculata]|uniref:uncharacterized protein LOC127255380 n=1 Tax=Andrographis paniculata TaxID=175694 RepID=UPI0021E8027E|nr:uncharacterized protein LOC127255380 [Andrographis paniculata]
MATDSKSSNLSKSKPGGADKPSSSKPKFDSKKKVVEVSIKTDSKHRSTSTTASKVTKKTSKTSVKTTAKTRVKKVYSLPGQKFDIPEEREPLRIFYESLSKQIPSSEMAEFWLMEHGILSPERAKKAYEKKQRKQKQVRMGTPVKSPPPRVLTKSAPSSSGKTETSQKMQSAPKISDVKAKKRIQNDSDDDDDFVLSYKRKRA